MPLELFTRKSPKFRLISQGTGLDLNYDKRGHRQPYDIMCCTNQRRIMMMIRASILNIRLHVSEYPLYSTTYFNVILTLTSLEHCG